MKTLRFYQKLEFLSAIICHDSDYIYPYTYIEAPFLGSGCSRVV